MANDARRDEIIDRPDKFVHELVNALIGDRYPVPDFASALVAWSWKTELFGRPACRNTRCSSSVFP